MRRPEVESQPAAVAGGAALAGPGTGDALLPPHAVAIVTSTASLNGAWHEPMLRLSPA